MKWHVQYSGRREGAIGMLYRLPIVEVEATSTRDALFAAVDRYHADGFEPHAPVFARPVGELSGGAFHPNPMVAAVQQQLGSR